MVIKTALDRLNRFNSIKQRQVTLPVARIRAVVNLLKVKDDLRLKTMFVSPDTYDKVLSELIYDHTKLLDVISLGGEHSTFDEQPKMQDFFKMISEFDKKSLLWGIYASTYENFGKQHIKCNKCENEWDDMITADQVVDSDSFSVWSEDKSFQEYIFPIEIDLNNNIEISKFIFNTYVPSIHDNLAILKFVSADKMKENFNRFNKLLSSSEELSLITKSIELIYKVIDKDTNEEKMCSEKIEGIYNIYNVISNYIPLNIIDTVSSEYDNKFKKYLPKFRKKYTCSQCNSDIDFPIDIESALFRSFLKI